MIGKTISHYKILEKLGGGGMGVVYKAKDNKLKRTVALKFLPPDLTRDDEAKERFMLEAQAASALDHPNICTIYEIDETEDGQLFIAMACYEGKSLKEIVGNGRDRSLPLTDILNYTTQIGKGLQAAHKKGIVHRDIKPANLMISSDGIVKILDFGLAKLAGATQLTKAGTTLGTVAYMSPEQSQGAEVDQRTDIWALGVILYEMLSGQHPFKGDYEQAVIFSVISEEPEPIADLPSELGQIVEKALQKDSAERYQTADDMLNDLQAFRTGGRPAVSKLSKRRSTPLKRSYSYLFGGLIALALLILIGFFTFRWSKPDKIRIAVLPFDNITRNPDDEYFADGMTDEMISKLSKIAGFGVIARTSVMHYKTNPRTIAEIGEELRVSKILEGSVRKAADKLRITVQLVDVKTQEPIWSSDYNRRLADVFAIQSDVAQQVASALRVELSQAEKSQIEIRGTESLEAYNLYLQGNYYAHKRTLPGVTKAIAHFNSAIELDPEFAKAFAGLASVYHELANYSYLPPTEVYPKAEAAAVRALEIDPTLANAHAELANIRFRFEWDWKGAENIFEHAIKLDPGNARAHHLYAAYLTSMGRHEQALLENRRCQELDPLDLIAHTEEGIILYHARRYDHAIEKLNTTIATESNFFVPYLWLTFTYLQKDDIEQAQATVQKLLSLTGGAPIAAASQAYVFAVSGKRAEAQRIIDQLQHISRQRFVPPTMIGLVYMGLNDKDKAFEWLQKAFEARDTQLLRLKVAPVIDSLRSDPRFTALLKKMGLE